MHPIDRIAVFIARACLIALSGLALFLVPSSAFAFDAHGANPLGWVSPHDDVTIEWWYLNAHVTTVKGRHLAVIGSFFRFGNAGGDIAMDSGSAKQERSHYLIYAITDEDTGAHKCFATADTNTLTMLRQALMLRIMMSPGDQRAQSLFSEVGKGRLPSPAVLFAGHADVAARPFHVTYANDDLREVSGKSNTYALTLGSGRYRVKLTFAGTRSPMYVGGDGNTGLGKPEDMKYVSLTRCKVSGAVSDGGGLEGVAGGIGWFDHQWGFSWTTQKAGWDWWGIQLDDGRDVLFFRQRDLATGTPFFPLATVEAPDGTLTVTKNITFASDPDSVWTSPRTGIAYPLRWTVKFPELNMIMAITPVARDQEMAVLASGGAIWEGSVKVSATDANGGVVHGVGYQELVGYGRPPAPATSP